MGRGPAALLEAGLVKHLRSLGHTVHEERVLSVDPYPAEIRSTFTLANQIAARVREAKEQRVYLSFCRATVMPRSVQFAAWAPDEPACCGSTRTRSSTHLRQRAADSWMAWGWPRPNWILRENVCPNRLQALRRTAAQHRSYQHMKEIETEERICSMPFQTIPGLER